DLTPNKIPNPSNSIPQNYMVFLISTNLGEEPLLFLISK
ncbi:hypothetical protein M2326_003445, partial [Flavobacterium sp. 7A]|nr:hypothetical protein [Flavobacterium sp. 7A]